jgi:DNA-binding NtrC family response regulator
MKKRRILLIELQNSFQRDLFQHLRQEGYEVFSVEKEKDVIELLSNTKVDAVILGLEGLKQEGVSVLRILRQRYPEINVITINSAERFDLSIMCMRLGAFDDFLIPFELDALMISLREAMGMKSDHALGKKN